MPAKAKKAASKEMKAFKAEVKAAKKASKKAKKKAAVVLVNKSPAMDAKQFEEYLRSKGGVKMAKPKGPPPGYKGPAVMTDKAGKASNKMVKLAAGDDWEDWEYTGDFQGLAATTDSGGAGFLGGVKVLPLNPLAFGTTVATEAQNWTMYCIKNFDMWVIPTGGTSTTLTTGDWTLAFDPDVVDANVVTMNVDYARSLKCKAVNQIYGAIAPKHLIYKPDQFTEKAYYCISQYQAYPLTSVDTPDPANTIPGIDANARQCFQGALIGICSGGAPVSSTIGEFQIKLVIRYMRRRVSTALPHQERAFRDAFESHMFQLQMFNSNGGNANDEKAPMHPAIFQTIRMHLAKAKALTSEFKELPENARKSIDTLMRKMERSEREFCAKYKAYLEVHRTTMKEMPKTATMVAASPVVIVDGGSAQGFNPAVVSEGKSLTISSNGIAVTSTGGSALKTQLVDASGNAISTVKGTSPNNNNGIMVTLCDNNGIAIGSHQNPAGSTYANATLDCQPHATTSTTGGTYLGSKPLGGVLPGGDSGNADGVCLATNTVDGGSTNRIWVGGAPGLSGSAVSQTQLMGVTSTGTTVINSQPMTQVYNSVNAKDGTTLNNLTKFSVDQNGFYLPASLSHLQSGTSGAFSYYPSAGSVPAGSGTRVGSSQSVIVTDGGNATQVVGGITANVGLVVPAGDSSGGALSVISRSSTSAPPVVTLVDSKSNPILSQPLTQYTDGTLKVLPQAIDAAGSIISAVCDAAGNVATGINTIANTATMATTISGVAGGGQPLNVILTDPSGAHIGITNGSIQTVITDGTGSYTASVTPAGSLNTKVNTSDDGMSLSVRPEKPKSENPPPKVLKDEKGGKEKGYVMVDVKDEDENFERRFQSQFYGETVDWVMVSNLTPTDHDKVVRALSVRGIAPKWMCKLVQGLDSDMFNKMSYQNRYAVSVGALRQIVANSPAGQLKRPASAK